MELCDNGAIKVDDSFRTAEPSIYAVGDAIDRMALTPVALMEGQWVAQRLFGEMADAVSYENIPTAVFCHPNLATCGYSEEQARADGLSLMCTNPALGSSDTRLVDGKSSAT